MRTNGTPESHPFYVASALAISRRFLRDRHARFEQTRAPDGERGGPHGPVGPIFPSDARMRVSTS